MKIVEALSQMTMCVVEKVEKQPVLTVWDKVKLWSPEMHHNVLHSATAGFEVSTHVVRLVKRDRRQCAARPSSSKQMTSRQ